MVQHRSADRDGLVGSSWYDSPAIYPSSFEGRVALFLATAASHALADATCSIYLNGTSRLLHTEEGVRT